MVGVQLKLYPAETILGSVRSICKAYTPWVKNVVLNSCSYFARYWPIFRFILLTDSGKIGTKRSLKFPLHLKGIATLWNISLIFKNYTNQGTATETKRGW